jgi:hypothetical protein
MSATESRPPERQDLLADAIASVQHTSIEDSLVERCRRNALAMADEEPNKCLQSKDDRLSRFFPLTAAASVLLIINLLQAYARLPSSDRQLAAVHVSSDSRRLYVYSDLRSEPAPSPDSDQRD